MKIKGKVHCFFGQTADQRECGVEWATKLFKEKYNFKNLFI